MIRLGNQTLLTEPSQLNVNRSLGHRRTNRITDGTDRSHWIQGRTSKASELSTATVVRRYRSCDWAFFALICAYRGETLRHSSCADLGGSGRSPKGTLPSAAVFQALSLANASSGERLNWSENVLLEAAAKSLERAFFNDAGTGPVLTAGSNTAGERSANIFTRLLREGSGARRIRDNLDTLAAARIIGRFRVSFI